MSLLTDNKVGAMSYFDRAYQVSNRVLRQFQMSTTQRSWGKHLRGIQQRIQECRDGQGSKSIFTENESQYLRTEVYNQIQDQNCNEDIQQFIENSKTLRQKIFDRLEKNKKNRNLIKQTTFRPSEMKRKPKGWKKQNLSPKNGVGKSTKKYNDYNVKSQMHLKNKQYQFRGCHYDENAYRVAQGKKPSERNIYELDFYQRQEKTISNRKDLTVRLKTEMEQKQMQGCTFKPKLTKYRPKRP